MNSSSSLSLTPSADILVDITDLQKPNVYICRVASYYFREVSGITRKLTQWWWGVNNLSGGGFTKKLTQWGGGGNNLP